MISFVIIIIGGQMIQMTGGVAAGVSVSTHDNDNDNDFCGLGGPSLLVFRHIHSTHAHPYDNGAAGGEQTEGTTLPPHTDERVIMALHLAMHSNQLFTGKSSTWLAHNPTHGTRHLAQHGPRTGVAAAALQRSQRR